MKLTIEELADKVNELIADKCKEQPELVKDGRQSSILSTRRIRDYITKGLIEKPVGSGREKWFDESHINALVSLRLLQHNGLSDQYIMNSTKVDNALNPFISSYSNEEPQKLYGSTSLNALSSDDEIMQNDALDFLKSLQGGKSAQAQSLSSAEAATNSISKDKSLSMDLQGYSTNADLLRSLNQTKYRQFNEYLIDEKLGVFLKVDSKTDMVLQKQLLETIKNEITKHNNKENKNG